MMVRSHPFGRFPSFGVVHVVVLLWGILSCFAFDEAQSRLDFRALLSRRRGQHGGSTECMGYTVCPGCLAIELAEAQMLLSGECTFTTNMGTDPAWDCRGSQYSRELYMHLQQGLCRGGCTAQAEDLCPAGGRMLLQAGKAQASLLQCVIISRSGHQLGLIACCSSLFEGNIP